MPEYVVILIRSVFSFLVLFTLARILGKKQISQLTFFDYVVGIVIGDMASTIAIDTSVQILNGIIGLFVFSLLSILISLGAMKSLQFRKIVESTPTLLIRDGKILEENLFKSKMPFDDLMLGLRRKSVFELAEVEYAVLETNGEISVMTKSEYRPLTPSDMGISVEKEHLQSLIIIDGTLLEKRLKHLGYSKDWLLEEIKKQGANDISDVFLAQINSSGKVYVDLFDDKESDQEGGSVDT